MTKDQERKVAAFVALGLGRVSALFVYLRGGFGRFINRKEKNEKFWITLHGLQVDHRPLGAELPAAR